MTRPLIGITTWRRPIDTAVGRGRPAHTLGVEYSRPIEEAGGAVVLLPPTAGVDETLDALDALVLSGGEDVLPARYGGPPQPGQAHDEERDAHEIALALGARERGLPTLAICRGLQVVNVAFGGTLIADLPQAGDHVTPTSPEGILAERHPVTLVAGSRLARVYGAAERVVNTIHHQAVDALAPGFEVTARAADGTVEGIETAGWDLWAVQWHPEKLDGPQESDEERRLFAALVAAAQTHRSRRGSGPMKGRR